MTGSTPASQWDVSGSRPPCRACAIAGILGLVAAVGITAAAHGDALPEDTRRIQGLSPEQARTLAAEFPGVDVVVTWHGTKQPLYHALPLDGLATIDAAAAAALAANDRWDGHLPDLHTLDSVAVAAALAAREGPLTLPWLKKSSLQALAALARKEDVEIPPLDQLELIPAPDGSPHDDVVIPDAFRERQRQRGQWLGPDARPAQDDAVPETL